MSTRYFNKVLTRNRKWKLPNKKQVIMMTQQVLIPCNNIPIVSSFNSSGTYVHVICRIHVSGENLDILDLDCIFAKVYHQEDYFKHIWFNINCIKYKGISSQIVILTCLFVTINFLFDYTIEGAFTECNQWNQILPAFDARQKLYTTLNINNYMNKWLLV